MRTTLDIALTRWAVRCRTWHDMGGDHPQLGAFLAGWFARDCGLPLPHVIPVNVRDSLRIGWKEADDHIAILEQQEEMK